MKPLFLLEFSDDGNLLTTSGVDLLTTVFALVSSTFLLDIVLETAFTLVTLFFPFIFFWSATTPVAVKLILAFDPLAFCRSFSDFPSFFSWLFARAPSLSLKPLFVLVFSDEGNLLTTSGVDLMATVFALVSSTFLLDEVLETAFTLVTLFFSFIFFWSATTPAAVKLLPSEFFNIVGTADLEATSALSFPAIRETFFVTDFPSTSAFFRFT